MSLRRSVFRQSIRILSKPWRILTNSCLLHRVLNFGFVLLTFLVFRIRLFSFLATRNHQSRYYRRAFLWTIVGLLDVFFFQPAPTYLNLMEILNLASMMSVCRERDRVRLKLYLRSQIIWAALTWLAAHPGALLSDPDPAFLLPRVFPADDLVPESSVVVSEDPDEVAEWHPPEDESKIEIPTIPSLPIPVSATYFCVTSWFCWVWECLFYYMY